MEHAAGEVFLSLIIPAYNEASGITQAIEEADEALTRLGRPFEILIVDDGSSDATASKVLEAGARRPRVRLLRHSENQGYGAALRTGFAAARGQRIAFTDADCQFYLDDLRSLLSLTDEHSIAAGYRADRQDPARRRLFSWGYNLVVRTLLGTGVRDCDCALKVFRREALAEILPQSRGFFVNAEMLTAARQRGLTIAEVAVRHRPRLKGSSKVRLSDIPRTLSTLIPFWWSRVLFPESSAGAMPTALRGHAESPCPRKAVGMAPMSICFLMVIAGFLFLTRLDCPLLEPEESRYAEIPRQMLAEGAFVTPVLNGSPYLQKPPLFYWLVIGSYQLFGVHDWAARLVPSTASMLVILIVYFWVRRTVGATAALWSALVLCLSARFVYQARMIILDGLLCLWVTGALAAGHIALHSRSRKHSWWVLSALCCGLGLLTKGPVALVLSAVPLVVYQALDHRVARFSMRSWLGYMLLAVAVAAPWYIAIALQHPAWSAEFFWLHHVLRFVDPVDHSKPVWFYTPFLMLGTLPWIVLIPFALRSRSAGGSPARGFFWIATLWPIVFFSIADCKRPAYILPAFPPLAMLAGSFLAGRLSLQGWLAFKGTLPNLCRLSLATAAFGFMILAISEWLPDYHRKFGLRGQVRRHAELAADPQLPIVSYPRAWESVGFYLKRSDVRAYSPDQQADLVSDLKTRPKTLLFVKTGSALDDLLKALPSDMQFLPRGRQGRLTAGTVEARNHKSSAKR